MKEKLSQFHIAILIFMIQTGITVFNMPNLVATYYGTNGWLSLLIFALIATFNIYLISEAALFLISWNTPYQKSF